MDVRMITVMSSNIASVGYDYDKEELHVQFKFGARYIFSKVPESLFEELLAADSKGHFFHVNIKNEFETRVAQ